MKKLIIIRHGKASMDGEDAERTLDEDGIIQAKSLELKLNNILDPGNSKIKIFSSPFKRALQTIEPFANNSNLTCNVIEDLREIKIGKSSKLTKHEIIKKMWEDKNFSSDTGESQNDYIKSIKSGINNVLNDFYSNDYNLIFMTHGNTIGILFNDFFSVKFSFESWKDISMPDLYIVNFNAKNKVENYKRDNKNIEKIFYIKK